MLSAFLFHSDALCSFCSAPFPSIFYFFTDLFFLLSLLVYISGFPLRRVLLFLLDSDCFSYASSRLFTYSVLGFPFCLSSFPLPSVFSVPLSFSLLLCASTLLLVFSFLSAFPSRSSIYHYTVIISILLFFYFCHSSLISSFFISTSFFIFVYIFLFPSPTIHNPSSTTYLSLSFRLPRFLIHRSFSYSLSSYFLSPPLFPRLPNPAPAFSPPPHSPGDPSTPASAAPSSPALVRPAGANKRRQ